MTLRVYWLQGMIGDFPPAAEVSWPTTPKITKSSAVCELRRLHSRQLDHVSDKTVSTIAPQQVVKFTFGVTKRQKLSLRGAICNAAPCGGPRVDFAPFKFTTFTATVNSDRKSASIKLLADEWDIDEGEFEAQVMWFAVNRELGLGAPDGVPKSLRPRRKGVHAIPGKSAKPVMGFWRGVLLSPP